MIIDDGTGKGTSAEVNRENMLTTLSTIATIEHHTNHNHGESYNLLFSQTPDTTSSCIIYVKNNCDCDIVFEGITCNTESNEYILTVLNNIGTPIGGVDATPVNLNAGVNNVASGVFQSGSNITGLSGGTIAFKHFIKGGESSKHYNFEQDIILPKNRTLTLCVVNGGIYIDGFLSFYFHGEL